MSALAGTRQNDTARQFSARLPECGQLGITADDLVVVEIVPRGTRHPRLGLIYASRPRVSGVFFDLLSSTPLRAAPNRAISVMMRCGTAPRARQPHTWDHPILEWAAGRGAYPILSSPDDSTESSLAKLTDRETRLGAESPFLIPVLAQLLEAQHEAEPSPDDIERLLGYARRLHALLVGQAAPPYARLPAALASTVLTAMSVQQSQQATFRAMRQTIEATAAEPAITTDALLMMAQLVPQDSTIAPGLKIALLRQALQRMQAAGPAHDIRIRGLVVQLVSLELGAGNESAAASLAREHGIGADLCAIAQTAPRYLGSEIRSEDYPPDAISGELFGSVTLDLGIDAQGVPGYIRQIVSSPPFVFDAVTAARAPTIRYEPAQYGGRARGCRGITQPVGWQLP